MDNSIKSIDDVLKRLIAEQEKTAERERRAAEAEARAAEQ